VGAACEERSGFASRIGCGFPGVALAARAYPWLPSLTPPGSRLQLRRNWATWLRRRSLGAGGNWGVWGSARCGQEGPHRLGGCTASGCWDEGGGSQFHRNWATLMGCCRIERCFNANGDECPRIRIIPVRHHCLLCSQERRKFS
jgi:hypothetical protein